MQKKQKMSFHNLGSYDCHLFYIILKVKYSTGYASKQYPVGTLRSTEKSFFKHNLALYDGYFFLLW